MRKTRALALLAFLFLSPVVQAAPVETHCYSLLAPSPAAGDGVGKAALALAQAWESLVRIEMGSGSSPVFRAWALSLSNAQSHREWLSPPAEILSEDAQIAFSQFASLFSKAEMSLDDTSALLAEWMKNVSVFIRAEHQREEARFESESARAVRPLRIAGRISLEVGAAAILSDVVELSDRKIVFSGFGDDDAFLALYDPRSGTPLIRIDVGAYPPSAGRRAAQLTALTNGGFVVSTYLGQLGFHLPSGNVLAAKDTQLEPGSGNWNHPVETPLGTIAYVNRSGKLSLHGLDGTSKGNPIELPQAAFRAQPFVLQDGRIAVWSPNHFQIYDAFGALHDDLSFDRVILDPPIQLSDGAIAIHVHEKGLVIHRSTVPGGRLVEEMTLASGHSLESTRVVELLNGTLALAASVGGASGLLFLDRAQGTRKFVPMRVITQSLPVPTPDGGLAMISGDGLLLMDADGEIIGESPVRPRLGYFIGTPVVFRPEGQPASAWRIATIDQHDLIVVDSRGNEVLRQQLVSPQGQGQAALSRIKALTDGALLTTDSRGVAQILRLQEVNP